MTGDLGILLKTELTNRFRWNTLFHEKNRKIKIRTIGVVVAFAILFLMMGGYSFGLAYGFGTMGMPEVIPGYAFTITALITLFFTFFKTNGILFGARDYDLLMALPIRTETIITAKFLSMYLNNLAFTMLVMVPMAIGYAMFVPGHVIAVLCWLVGILVAPLLPMTIAAIVGTLIIGIGSGFRHKVLVQAILTIAVVAGVFSLSFVMQKTAAQDPQIFMTMFADLGAVISGMIHRIYPLSAWFDTAVNEKNMLFLLLLLAVSVAIYGVFGYVCARQYRKINSALKSHHATSNYKVKTLKSSSMMAALVRKEWKRFTSSIVYMMNIGMGLILALLVAVVSLCMGMDKVIGAMNIGDMDVIRPILAYVMPFGVAMLVNMCNTTCVSYSLEGQNLWVVKSLPISRKTMLQAKMLFNLVLVLPVSLICNIIFMIQLSVSLPMAACYLIFAVTSVALSTVWGSYVNVHFPNFTWENEIQVIKQGMSSMIGIFSSMVFYLLMAVGAATFGRMIPGEAIVLGCSLVSGIAAWFIYRNIH